MHPELPGRLLEVYRLLEGHFGHEPHWWPIVTDDPPFEVLVGAVLVQQTRWQTVEAAVVRLRDAGLMRPEAMAAADTAALAALIRPCAFHTQKAPGLQAICRHLLDRHAGSLPALLAGERGAVRAELLALPRVGRETADTVMLYAGRHALFVVDAYTRRLFERVGVAPGFDMARAPYDALQALVEGALAGRAPAAEAPAAWQASPPPHPSDPPDLHFYRQFHALIVEACIHHCLATRRRQDAPGLRPAFVDARKCSAHCAGCVGCPLRAVCASYAA